jgi:hypothetical protein
MKAPMLLAWLSAAALLPAQSTFDPVVADQIRHQQEEIERLRRETNGAPTPMQKSAAELDEEARKSAGVSKADWEKRKGENDPFRNDTFTNSRSKAAQGTNTDDAAFKAALLNSLKIAIARYPQFADRNSEFTKKYVEIENRLAAQRNPIILQANAPERVADIVAGELKITPKR